MKEITLTITAKATWEPGQTSGNVHMSHAANSATVSDEGKELGQIGGTFGAGYEIKDKATGITWYIEPAEFWRAFQEAADAQLTAAVRGEGG